MTLRQQLVIDERQRLQRFGMFAIGQYQCVALHIAQGLAYSAKIQRRHDFIGNDQCTTPLHERSQQISLRQQALANENGIGALAQTDFQRNHLSIHLGGFSGPAFLQLPDNLRAD